MPEGGDAGMRNDRRGPEHRSKLLTRLRLTYNLRHPFLTTAPARQRTGEIVRPLAPESRLFPLRVSPPQHSLALAALLVVGCASNPTVSGISAGSRENGVLVLTRDDDQRTAEVRVWGTNQVRLPGHGTGFVWAVDETDRQRLALDSTG